MCRVWGWWMSMRGVRTCVQCCCASVYGVGGNGEVVAWFASSLLKKIREKGERTGGRNPLEVPGAGRSDCNEATAVVSIQSSATYCNWGKSGNPYLSLPALALVSVRSQSNPVLSNPLQFNLAKCNSMQCRKHPGLDSILLCSVRFDSHPWRLGLRTLQWEAFSAIVWMNPPEKFTLPFFVSDSGNIATTDLCFLVSYIVRCFLPCTTQNASPPIMAIAIWKKKTRSWSSSAVEVHDL